MNKVQWQRKDSMGLELYVYEELNGVHSWKLYTSSKLFVRDIALPGASRGLETFRACLKAGYILLDVNGKEVTL